MKLGWIVFHIVALENLRKNQVQLREEMHQYKKQDIDFFVNYVSSTIAELSAMYVYLKNKMIILPFGFMQHGIQLTGRSGPALGDFIEATTLSFVDVKSSRTQISPQGLMNLMVATRLPSAYIIPRYSVKDDKIDNPKLFWIDLSLSL